VNRCLFVVIGSQSRRPSASQCLPGAKKPSWIRRESQWNSRCHFVDSFQM